MREVLAIIACRIVRSLPRHQKRSQFRLQHQILLPSAARRRRRPRTSARRLCRPRHAHDCGVWRRFRLAVVGCSAGRNPPGALIDQQMFCGSSTFSGISQCVVTRCLGSSVSVLAAIRQIRCCVASRLLLEDSAANKRRLRIPPLQHRLKVSGAQTDRIVFNAAGSAGDALLVVKTTPTDRKDPCVL